jgi:DNA-binding Xre family transcriptional regulator
MATKKVPSLITIYARNIEIFAFKRGWSMRHLAEETGCTVATLTRVRMRHNKTIDPELLASLLNVFSCHPDDLLLPQPDVDYSLTTS